jgi:Transcription factor WhiB
MRNGAFLDLLRALGQGWRLQAACRQYPLINDGWRTLNGHLWDPDGLDQIDPEAQRICEGCPVRDECLDFAMTAEAGLAASGRYGIAGGLTRRQRAELARRPGSGWA